MQAKGWLRVLGALGLAVCCFLATSGSARAMIRAGGWSQPFFGDPRYERFAPVEAASGRQVNRPLGLRLANRIAGELGLNPKLVFTHRQFVLFVTGTGHRGEKAPAELVDKSVRILTNTRSKPLYAVVRGRLTKIVLGSYGLLVNPKGWLESPANLDAATRQVNEVIKPGGYLGRWAALNGAERSIRMLYHSAYRSEVVFGNRAQKISGAAQLVPNQKGRRAAIVGMSMAPALWIVNFTLIYTLNPKLAANMPVRWTPIPARVALALAESPTGRVRYARYESLFPRA